MRSSLQPSSTKSTGTTKQVYEALDAMAHSSWDLAAVALLSPAPPSRRWPSSALMGWPSATGTAGGAGRPTRAAVARSLGVLGRVGELLERYRAHRHAWRQRLLAGGLLTVAAVLAATRPTRPTRPPRPDANEPETGAEAGQRWLTRQPQPPPSPAHAPQAARAARTDAATGATGATATAPPGGSVPGPVLGSVPGLGLGEAPEGVPGDVLELLRLELGAVVLA